MLCRMITWVVFLWMFLNFISSLPVKRGGSLSFLVGTISNVLVMEIGWRDVGSGGYILVSCAHSNTSCIRLDSTNIITSITDCCIRLYSTNIITSITDCCIGLDSTNIITSITDCCIRLAVILVIISVFNFITAIILYSVKPVYNGHFICTIH